MRTAVFSMIECDYNRWRRHSACGGLSPEQFENRTSLGVIAHITLGGITVLSFCHKFSGIITTRTGICKCMIVDTRSEIIFGLPAKR